eukprot:gene24134-10218_t
MFASRCWAGLCVRGRGRGGLRRLHTAVLESAVELTAMRKDVNMHLPAAGPEREPLNVIFLHSLLSYSQTWNPIIKHIVVAQDDREQ